MKNKAGSNSNNEGVAATIRDVARESGVSVTTASVVLSNSKRVVSTETRQRVLDAAARLRYQPNIAARGLVRRSSQILGVHLGSAEPDSLANPATGAVLQGITETAATVGYRVLLHPMKENSSEPLGSYRDGVVAGYVLLGSFQDMDLLAELSQSGFPLVSLSSSEHPAIPCVDVDHRAGASLITRHLIDLGHTALAHLTGDPGQAHIASRREGFLEALRHAGLPLRLEYLEQGACDPRAGYALARQLLTLSDRPTALVCGSDFLAFAALEAARDLGLSVPGDISITGFDDIPFLSSGRQGLTTVRLPLCTIGTTATKLLLDQLDGGDVAVRNYLLPPELILRDTTAIPKTTTVSGRNRPLYASAFDEARYRSRPPAERTAHQTF